jgi:hypothetical protein
MLSRVDGSKHGKGELQLDSVTAMEAATGEQGEENGMDWETRFQFPWQPLARHTHADKRANRRPVLKYQLQPGCTSALSLLKYY